MRVRCVLSATIAAVALFAAPGCARLVTGRPTVSALSEPGSQAPVVAAPKRSVCEEVLAPLSPIQARSPAEPVLRIPQPPGWQRATELDSDVVRYAMTNQDLAGNGFMPTAVVTLEFAPGTNQDQQKIFDQERAMLSDRLGVTNMRTTETTRCGQRAEVVRYDAPALAQIPPRAATTLIVIAAFSGNEYAVTVTVQAANPGNPTYVRDTQAILTGFQMLPPATG
jgi:hypothetical protein